MRSRPARRRVLGIPRRDVTAGPAFGPHYAVATKLHLHSHELLRPTGSHIGNRSPVAGKPDRSVSVGAGVERIPVSVTGRADSTVTVRFARRARASQSPNQPEQADRQREQPEERNGKSERQHRVLTKRHHGVPARAHPFGEAGGELSAATS